MWSPMEKCWVPNCLNSRDQGYSKNFFPLPKSERYKEIWLALAGKKSSGLEELIYYCQDHFDPLSLQTYSEKFIILDANATPFFNMPQRVCRTCMSVIVDGDIFCVLSANVPCTIPSEIKSELFTCRPEPLLQVLNFCIPELKLSLDPLPLTCYKCYYNIWLFYTFKVTCNSVEKNYLGHSGPSPYGKLMICRACPVTAGTSFFDLKEDSLLAKLLRKMFIQVQPTELVPLKVCLKCWNTLYQLEKFYMHCLEVETRMKRDTFHLQYDMSGPIPTPSSSTATQTFKSPPNAVKVHRRSLHPYRPHEPSTSTSISVNTPSTSMMRFDGRNQNKHGFGDNTVEALPNTMILPTTQLNVPLNSSKVEKSTDNKSLNTAQNVDSVKIKKETEVISISDDDAELRCTEFIDPWVKRTLNDTEKIALAELMLKYGLPFKTSTSPKIHFEAWVKIVREFIQLGHERPLELIQNTWKQMKKEALTSTETTGPADQINKLVQEYLRNPSTVVDVSKVKVEKEEVKQCEVICLDDDDKVKNKTEENAIKSKKRGRPPRSGTSKIAKPAKGTIKATVKTKGKLQKPRRRKGMVRKTTTLRDKWSQENKVDLVRRMRKEYDALLKSNELVNGYSPWRRVIQNIHKKYYSTYKLEKLLTVWCQMKLSATIHEKNGCDIVDDEVWDMLQIQNAVHKSVANKNSNGATANKVNLREKSKAAVSEKDGGNNSDSKPSTSKPVKPTQVPEKIPDVPVPPKPVESQKHIWTNEEKLQLVKLIKAEFISMTKNKQWCSWKKVVDRVAENHYDLPNTTVMAMWSQMRRNASINESEGRMSITDQKILRLQRLYNRVRKGYSPLTKKQEKVQDVKWEAKTLKEERIPKVTLVKKQQTSKKDEDNSKETDEECTNIKRLKTSHQEKLDIFEAIKKCGPKVFKKDNLMKREYWSQVLNEVNAKGHKWSSGKLRNNWQYMLNKAKQAWAGQREPGDIDKLIIDFMTEVIQSKAKTDMGESTNTEHRDETDDKFDEVSERMSEPISNGDPVSNNTEDVKNTLPDYDYVSLEDIEKGLVENDETTNTVQIKKELVEVKQENEFPFKIESYTSEEVVEILDSDDDQKL